MLDAKGRKGKIRHIGITEAAIVDHTNEMLKRALSDPVWEVIMVAIHMMHQAARSNVFAQTQAKGVGTLLMFAVRSIFADPRRLKELELENSRLRKAVSDLTLDKLILQEAARGNF